MNQDEGLRGLKVQVYTPYRNFSRTAKKFSIFFFLNFFISITNDERGGGTPPAYN